MNAGFAVFALISLLLTSSVLFSVPGNKFTFADEASNNSTRIEPEIREKQSRESDININIAEGDENSKEKVKENVQPKPNRKPRANAGPDLVVNVGDKVILDAGRSDDPDKDKLRFAWTQVSPKMPHIEVANPDSKISSFVAPEVNRPVQFSFILTLTDGNGGTSKDLVKVRVTTPPSKNENIHQLDSKANSLNPFAKNHDRTSNGIVSNNDFKQSTPTAQSDIVGSFSYTSIHKYIIFEKGFIVDESCSMSGPVEYNPNGAYAPTGTWEVSYDSNNVPPSGIDDFGGSVPGTSDANVFPRVDGQIRVSNQGMDSDFGFSDANGLGLCGRLFFHEPLSGTRTREDGDHTFSLYVSETWSLNINPNKPPIAQATVSPSGDIPIGNTVTLDGRSSTDPDPNDRVWSYEWQQISGPEVTVTPVISNPAVARFTTPDVNDDTTLKFQLVVSDTHGARSEPFTVDVLVLGPDVCSSTTGTRATLTAQNCGDFSINCPSGQPTEIAIGRSGDLSCALTSQNGFRQKVDLTCNVIQVSQIITCTASPTSLTPSTDGTIPFTISIRTTDDTEKGSYDVIVKGTSGATIKTIKVPLDCISCFKPVTIQRSYSQPIVDFIRGEEGYAGRLKNTCDDDTTIDCKITGDKYGLYQDSHGYCTSGFGHLIYFDFNGKKFKTTCQQVTIDKYNTHFPNGMTYDEANTQMLADITAHEKYVTQYVKVQLTQDEHNALVSFTFNTGPGGLKNLLNNEKVIKNGKCDALSIQNAFLEFQNKDRRQKEADIFNHGNYPPKKF